MTNVIQFKAPQRSRAARIDQLIGGFAMHRRQTDDVFWLKENAELLGILVSSKAAPGPEGLAPFERFYAQIEKRARFFPQYYRFFLSLCLDLEDLGMVGTAGEQLCGWAHSAGLAEAELSDLQRAEARRLMARRGHEGPDGGLTDRLHAFISRSATFAMPNKKAAYELTHIVFYLSEYGTRDPQLPESAITSLEFAGLLAFLDQNIDLLAEICVALRCAGTLPPAAWENAVATALSGAVILETPQGAAQDDYHAYLVAAWSAMSAGGEGLAKDVPEGQFAIAMPRPALSALRPMSECIFAMDDARDGNWGRMRDHVAGHLDADRTQILLEAEQSTDKFDAFFAGFARA